ncbi:MAG: UMP kinase [Thermoplasmatales archaeon]|nr:UMP kinase [Thermoplasmatales archaeon]
MKSIIISIGGSVILSEEVDVSFFKELASLLKKFSKQYKIFVIVGGGNVARKYIKLGRDLRFDEKVLDSIGIYVTRVNAKILTNIIEGSNKDIPCTTDEAIEKDKPIVVMGGTTPGHSTDMVGAELAEKTGADLFIIATNVDGIYDKDPNKYSDAKQLKEVKIDQLIESYGTKWKSAGKNIVIDGPALGIIKRAKLVTYVVNGKRLDQLEKALTDQSFDGTKITI